MPLYEFRCPQGHDFEKFYRSIGAAQSEEKCPECGEAGARLMSTAGLVFKGSGFYITDYGKDGKKDLREAKSSKPDTEGKPDAKPADSSPKAAEPAAPAAPAAAAKTESKPAAAPAAKAPAKKAE